MCPTDLPPLVNRKFPRRQEKERQTVEQEDSQGAQNGPLGGTEQEEKTKVVEAAPREFPIRRRRTYRTYIEHYCLVHI